MKKTKHLINSSMVIVITITIIINIAFPTKTFAGMPVTDTGNIAQSTISAISNVGTQVSTFFSRYKESVLDPLAWALAKQLIQSMTADVVNWINSGFDGNPAFLTNPESFFIDVADQATGEFIANSGPLSSLCSPFNIDLRLSIALNQTSQRTRYACTLSTIINNARNTTINGQSIDGFMGGDFNQGGWPAFIALTTQPQNSYTGAYLVAQSDLNAQISGGQARISADISAGNGIMSWKKCTDLQTFSPDAEESSDYYYDPTVNRKVNSDGSVTYQNCHIETPGSVISNSLNKQLGAPTDSLVTADEFNEILNALFNQLIKTVLTGGLHSSSQIRSGQTQSFINQMSNDGNNTSQDQKQIIINGINEYIKPTTDYKSIYDRAIIEINTLEQLLQTIKNTCQARGSTNGVEHIQGIIDGRFASIKTEFTGKASEAARRLQILNEVKIAIQNARNSTETNAAATRYNELVQAGSLTNALDLKNAQDDLDSLKETLSDIRNDARIYQYLCTSL